MTNSPRTGRASPKARRPRADAAGAKTGGPNAPRGPTIAILRELAALGGLSHPVVASSREVGERVGLSQQAADRYLVRLESDGLISRQMASRRQRLTVTPTGSEALRREYEVYRRLFEGPTLVRFRGTIESGLGEGRYYLSQPGYAVQFTERLGYSPYPGTLNVGVPPEALGRLETIRRWRGLRIDGFKAGERTFGGAACHVARLNGRPCHAIVPDRTHHQRVVEFIAAERLRDGLGVKDGDIVDVEIEEA